MTARHTPPVGTPRVQVKQHEPVHTPEPVQEYIPEAYNYSIPDPEPIQEPASYSASAVPSVTPSYTPAPPPVPKAAPPAANVPDSPKEDLDRTLTFAAIRESSSAETAAVREYNRMKAQLRESRVSDDASKVVLDRLPEGFVYVKMSIDDADRLSKKKNIPKPLIMAVAGAAIITVFLIVLLLIITGTGGKSTPAIVGKWQGEIEPLRFGITGIPFTRVDTVWDFDKEGNVKILPQDSMLAGYDLAGTYTLSDDGDNKSVHLDLDYYGEKIAVDVIYSIDADKMIISSRDQPSHTYDFEKLN